MDKRTERKINWKEIYSYKLYARNKKKISEARISMAHPVQQYTLEGEFINEFRNSKEASETLNICRRNIDYCISGKQKTCKGFIFKRKGK